MTDQVPPSERIKVGPVERALLGEHVCQVCGSSACEWDGSQQLGCTDCGYDAEDEGERLGKVNVCYGCGQILGMVEYDAVLWDLHHRIDDGRCHREALVFIPGEHFDPGDEDDRESVMLAMERDMHSRGLCTECGRPDLRGVDPRRILSKEDADDLADMYAEMEAERRMGA